ncbi:MAG: hypothetical protein K6E33_08810 [Lachnospiraceae bacterium]|nr:hypothetical protein [Lachnospiraceae bacterium]
MAVSCVLSGCYGTTDGKRAEENISAGEIGSMKEDPSNDTSDTEKAQTEDDLKKDYSNIVENPNIAIPGYESIILKAGEKTQSVNFYNPGENTCYFKISLVVDGATCWTSELLEPGEEIHSIELTGALEAGDHPATLKYECFSLKDQSPLNGSNIELVLHVK